MTVTIYHNPRCSKSRETLELLSATGVSPTIIEYLKTPPDAETLKTILKKLGFEPRDLMRKKEAPYKELGLDDANRTADDLIDAMVENPILIERPVVVVGERAALGRPPDNVMSLFDD